jgi:hypothetical protein
MFYFWLGRYCTNQLISLSKFPVICVQSLEPSHHSELKVRLNSWYTRYKSITTWFTEQKCIQLNNWKRVRSLMTSLFSEKALGLSSYNHWPLLPLKPWCHLWNSPNQKLLSNNMPRAVNVQIRNPAMARTDAWDITLKYKNKIYLICFKI